MPGIQLCGRFAAELSGRNVEDELPGRKGRLALAYLVANRDRPVTRDELIEVLWPEAPPAAPDELLSALLSKLRRSIGRDALQGRRELTLALPAGGSVDAEEGAAALARAEAALASEDWRAAWDQASAARRVAERGFLAGMEGVWVEER